MCLCRVSCVVLVILLVVVWVVLFSSVCVIRIVVRLFSVGNFDVSGVCFISICCIS